VRGRHGDDKLIGRLWAKFATPKSSGQWLREHTSNLPLTGNSCRGFQLYAGEEGGIGRDAAVRSAAPRLRHLAFRADYLHVGFYLPERCAGAAGTRPRASRVSLAKYGDAYLQTRSQNQRSRSPNLMRASWRRQASGRSQMQLAARLWGHCCICGKPRTDPISQVRGIGPDCYSQRVDYIRANAALPVEFLMLKTSMPRDFFDAVIREKSPK
jgi:hypothetical protein